MRQEPVTGIELSRPVHQQAVVFASEPGCRHADWEGAEFTAESRSHVSVYRLG